MDNIYSRTEMLLGKKTMDLLKNKKIIVFGIGGVGGYVVEALSRVGIGKIGLVDFDLIDVTNINRQLAALHSTIGKKKVEIMEERIHDINPSINVEIFDRRLTADNVSDFRLEEWDYVVDAIDDVKGKIVLIKKSRELDVPLISSMGTGFRFKPEYLKIADIMETHTCPLAKKVRKELKKIGIVNQKVLFSSEPPIKISRMDEVKIITASIAFIPGIAGLMLTAEIIKDLQNKKE